MKLCLAIAADQGLASQIYGHFGSAPAFLLHDTESGETTCLSNADSDHSHGACNPVAALAGQQVDAILVGGIGGRAVSKLTAMGIKVYQARSGSAQDNIVLFCEGSLPEMNPAGACSGHGDSGHGCGEH